MSRCIYCISGLGADERAFSRLQLPGYELRPISWIAPEPNESFSSYAKRMGSFIEEPEPIIIGLSFGGMLAVELAKQLSIKKLILISSVKTRMEEPWWMRISGKLKLHKAVKPKPHPLLYPIENYFLGVSTKPEKKLASHFRETVNKTYLQWAIDQIVNWNNVTNPANCLHIHGNADRLFPIRNVKADFVIDKGGHFMVYNKAAEISSIIFSELQRS
ncbi:MAG: alpha/beta hydrolase [Lacibacter sp.]|nr:alpha/beta hydrolase [Lacibacter sp.]